MGSSERGRDPLLGRDDLEMRSSVSDDEAEEQKPLSVSGKALVLILFCILTLIATFEKVALKKATDSLNLYQVFLNQLIVSLFIIVFLGVVVYKSRTSADITPEMRRFPKWKFALISICDTLAGLLILIPARHVSGDLLTLLIQGTVPATLLFSVTILKKRFHWLHYVGCFVILVGIFLNTLPYIEDDSNGAVDSVWYTIPLFLSCFPAALSGICAEIALQGQDMDIYYYQLWVAISQFFMAAILSPLSFVLQSPGVSVSDLPHNVYEGLMCWLPGVSHPSPTCDDGFSSVAIYLGLCIVFNIFISLVVKHGGAVTMMVALTMAVPLQYLVFSVKTPYFVPVPSTLHTLNFIGLAVTIVGLVGYHWAKEPDVHEEDMTDKQSTAISRQRIASMSPSLAPFTPRLASTPRASPAAAYVMKRNAELSSSAASGGNTRTFSVGARPPNRGNEAPF